MICHIFDDRIARNSDLLAGEFLDGELFRPRRCNKFVTAVRHGSNLDVEAAILGKRNGEQIGNSSIKIAALQSRIPVHSTLERVQFHIQSLFCKISFFLCNDEWNGIRIRHETDFQRTKFLFASTAAAGRKEQKRQEEKGNDFLHVHPPFVS